MSALTLDSRHITAVRNVRVDTTVNRPESG
jgi:hypothetical protein